MSVRYGAGCGTSCGTDLVKAAHFLQQGKLVAVPTETVYGLAANGLDEEAVLSIFRAKKRPHFDPLILHVAKLDALSLLVKNVPDLAYTLAQSFWPGPLTLLLDKTDLVPDLVSSGLPRVAVRIPAHPLTLELLARLDFPLAAPSANPFSYVSPTTAQHVEDQLGQQVSYIVDGGECEVGIESTIIGFENNQPTVFRLGGLSIEAIEKISGPLTVNLKQGQSPVAPGMIKNHYAPNKPLELGSIKQVVSRCEGDGSLNSLGILSFSEDWSDCGAGLALRLSPGGNIDEAARNVFAALRQLDKAKLSRIVVEKVPDAGLGRAINDRLQRASSSK